MTKRILFLNFLCFLLISCSNNDDFESKTYHFHSVGESSLKMYTNENEITDSEIIDKYINKFNQSHENSLGWPFKDDSYYETFEVNFHTISPKKMIVEYNNNKMEAIVYEKDGITYIAEKDTINYPSTLVKNEMLKCLPYVIDEVPISASTGSSNMTRFLKTKYASINNGELSIPFISIIGRRYQNGKETGFIRTYNDQNFFDQDYQKNMEKTDTIVVEERKIIYR